MNANRYSKFIPLQVASSTAATIFAVDTVGGTHQFVVQGSGSVGIGTSTPWAKLSIHANNGGTNGTLFAVASLTANSTSTLFSISNTGSTTLFQIPSTILTTDANGTIVGTSSIGVGYGGTGLTSVADGSLLFGGGSANLQALATSSLGGYLSVSYTTGRPAWTATTSLFAGGAGQTLAFLNGAWTGAATTTNSCSSGINCTFSAGTWSFTNTYGYPLASNTTFATTTAATTTSIWTQGVFFASSTVATSTFAGGALFALGGGNVGAE